MFFNNFEFDALKTLVENLESLEAELSYSLEEKLTMGKWTNGKPIYKKTIHLSSLPNATQQAYPHNISNREDFIKIEAWGKSVITGSIATIPMIGNPSTPSDDTAIYVGSSDITIWSTSDVSTWTGDITLYYTKTTD